MIRYFEVTLTVPVRDNEAAPDGWTWEDLLDTGGLPVSSVLGRELTPAEIRDELASTGGWTEDEIDEVLS